MCRGNPPFPEFSVELDGAIHRAQQINLVEGLLQEVDGAVFHGTNTGGYVAVAGDKDDGRVESPVGHAFLKSEPIHARHLDVEHDASWLFGRGLLEIGLGRLEGPDQVARGPKQPGQCRPNTLVVVHHVDRRLTLKGSGSYVH